MNGANRAGAGPVSEGERLYQVVEAKLKRPPQDGLQAAVVLEAWGGVKAPYSFSVVPSGRVEAAPIPDASRDTTETFAHRIGEMAAMAVVVLSAIMWVPILQVAHGYNAIVAAVWGLPLALALDWGIRVRYLGSGNVRSLRYGIIGLASILLLVGIGAVIGWRNGYLESTVVIAVALAAIWGQASISMVRRIPLVYGSLIAAVTVVLFVFDGSLWVLIGSACCVGALSLIGVWTESDGPTSRREPGLVVVASAVTGGGTGVVLTSDITALRADGVGIFVALVVLTVAGWVASFRLARLWRELPRKMADIPLTGYRGSSVSATFRKITLAALAVVAVPAALVVAVAIVALDGRGAPLLAAYGAFTLANLVVSLNLLSRRWYSSAVVVCIGAAISVSVPDVAPGLALASGSLFILTVGGAIAVHTFRDAAVAFSTRMMIT